MCVSGNVLINIRQVWSQFFNLSHQLKGNIYNPVNNYNYVEDTKVGVSI